LAIGSDQKIYAGGYNEIGYVAEDAVGSPRFFSLKHRLREDQRETGHVWNILVNNDNVYFSTDRNILVWQNDKFTEIKVPSEGKFFSAMFNDQILIQPSEGSLVVLNGESLDSLPDGDFYKGKVITNILPYDNDVALICTMNHGLFFMMAKRTSHFSAKPQNF
jgi:hypothetical protein